MQWLTVALCFLVVALDGFDTAIMGFVAPALADAWHVARADLAPVLSAALFGLAIGALCAGPLSDRYGRRRVLLVSVLTFGLFTLAAAAASSMTGLIAFRFLTGLGLGAAMPNAITLTSEYGPARRRAFITMIMFAGFTLGSAAGGFIAAAMIPMFGWQSMLALGGVLPLGLFVLLWLWLPESPRFLVVRQRPAAEVAALLRRIAPLAFTERTRFVIPEKADVSGRSSIAVLFVDRLASGTVLLWLTYFMGLAIIYMLGSWLPTLIRDAGFDLEQAAVVTGLFQLGGTVGAILVGWLMDRISPYRVIAAAYAFGAVFIFAVGRGSGDIVLLAGFVLGAGFCMSGAQSAMSALAAAFYPTRGRATGVAWMLGIGRFGAIAGAMLGGVLLQLGWHFASIFALLAVPALIAAAALLIKEKIYR
ncbi:MFS transporter [Solimonas marina]|uniref:MFS transporter n=1 Tax=Solimonas marina TaxID=2714601 RepID=A0A969WFG3_9GAMM|nr:MFS transporter [Solimonas marina]